MNLILDLNVESGRLCAGEYRVLSPSGKLLGYIRSMSRDIRADHEELILTLGMFPRWDWETDDIPPTPSANPETGNLPARKIEL